MFSIGFRSLHEHPYDVLISALQKGIRRGNAELTAYAILELMMAPTLPKACITNVGNRLRVCAIEDVFAGCPDAVIDVAEPLTAANLTPELALGASLVLCNSPRKSREPSYLRNAFFQAVWAEDLRTSLKSLGVWTGEHDATVTELTGEPATTVVTVLRDAIHLADYATAMIALSFLFKMGVPYAMTMLTDIARARYSLDPRYNPGTELCAHTLKKLSAGSGDRSIVMVALTLFISGLFYNEHDDLPPIPNLAAIIAHHQTRAKMEMPDYVIDKHTKAGRALHRGREHFATVSSDVENEWLPDWLAPLKEAYLLTRTHPWGTVFEDGEEAPDQECSGGLQITDVGPLLSFKTVAFVATMDFGDGSHPVRKFMKLCSGTLEKQAALPVYIDAVKREVGLLDVHSFACKVTGPVIDEAAKAAIEHPGTPAKWRPKAVQLLAAGLPGQWQVQDALEGENLNSAAAIDALTKSRAMQMELVKLLFLRAVFGLGDTNGRNLMVLSNGRLHSCDEVARDTPFPVTRMWAQGAPARVAPIVAARVREDRQELIAYLQALFIAIARNVSRWSTDGHDDMCGTVVARCADLRDAVSGDWVPVS